MEISSRIILTRPGGFVSIVCPSANCIRWMGSGGRWGHCTRGWIDTQIERTIAAGHRPDAVRRFVHAMAFGGCTTAGALGIIRDRDCAHRGTGIELWNVEDVPSDRWFRDAWRRSANGGPIWIDLAEARKVQRGKVKRAVAHYNKRAVEDDEEASLMRLTNGPALIEWDWPYYRQQLLAASTPEAIRIVWPAELRMT